MGPDHILLPRYSIEKRVCKFPNKDVKSIFGDFKRFRRLAERVDEDDGDYAGEGWAVPDDIEKESDPVC